MPQAPCQPVETQLQRGGTHKRCSLCSRRTPIGLFPNSGRVDGYCCPEINDRYRVCPIPKHDGQSCHRSRYLDDSHARGGRSRSHSLGARPHPKRLDIIRERIHLPPPSPAVAERLRTDCSRLNAQLFHVECDQRQLPASDYLPFESPVEFPGGCCFFLPPRRAPLGFAYL
jgi:hypothetical protein